MANENLILNIYNSDGTSFHGLCLHDFTCEDVTMGLSTKIEGDIYYKDNALLFTFAEYVIYKNIKYSLKINTPPTILQKDLAQDNEELKGMTKYSITFFHPMYQLYNIPFVDVPINNAEKLYKSQDNVFYWKGTLTQLKDKINNCLSGTPWTCNLQTIDSGAQSDVIQFSNQMISDVLKTGYDTFDVPFIIDGYNILFGKPSQKIYKRDGVTPFIFKMGQGSGLTNNDRTPKNNLIITRISGYGSETNIPNGYPKIKWIGDQTWKYSINNDSTSTNSYPIIDGVIDGVACKLINHPFTRKHLMPNIYVNSVNKKVNRYAVGYDPNTPLVDYYDATDPQIYQNLINPLAPSYYQKAFDGSDKTISNIKPSIVGATYNGHNIDIIESISWINDDKTPAEKIDDTYDATKQKYVQGYFQIELKALGFDLYAMAAITSAMSIEISSGACNGCKFELGADWDLVKQCFYDDNGNFNPNLQKRWDSGSFPDSTNTSIKIIVEKDISTFGTLMPNIYQQPTAGDKFIISGIDLPEYYITNAQGLLDIAMKNYMVKNNIAYYEYPFDFDNYFLINNKYILDQISSNSLISFEYAGEIKELSIKEYSVNYGENVLPTYKFTLTDEISISQNDVEQVATDVGKIGNQLIGLKSVLDKNLFSEFAKKLSKIDNDTAQGIITFLQGIKFGQSSIDGIGNALLQSVSAALGINIGTDFSINQLGEAILKSVKADSATIPVLNQVLSLVSKNFLAGSKGFKIVDESGESFMQIGELLVTKKAVFDALEIKKMYYVGGNLIQSSCGSRIAAVEEVKSGDTITGYKCYLKTDDGTTATTNGWRVGFQALCKTFNVKAGVYANVSNKYYWRAVTAVADDGSWIILSNEAGLYDSGTKYIPSSIYDSVPSKEDNIVQLGVNTNDLLEYSNAIVLLTTGDLEGIFAPAFIEFQNIIGFDLTGKAINYISRDSHHFTGDFYLENGKSVVGFINDSIAISVKSADNTNMLKDSTFEHGMLFWKVESNYSLYAINQALNPNLLSLNGKFYTQTGNYRVELYKQNGINCAHIINSQLTQVGTAMIPGDAFKSFKSGDGPINLRFSAMVKAVTAGTLHISYGGQSKSIALSASSIFSKIDLSGFLITPTLSGSVYVVNLDDLSIIFDGECYIYNMNFREDSYQNTMASLEILKNLISLSVSTEKSERETSDSNLSGLISSEKTNRENGDSANQTQITKLGSDLAIQSDMIDERVSELQIRGRNLIVNSDFRNGLITWSSSIVDYTSSNYDLPAGKFYLRFTIASPRIFLQKLSSYIPILLNTAKYTLSCYVRSSIAMTLEFGFSGTAFVSTQNVMASWTRLYFTFTGDNSSHILYFKANSVGSIDIAGIQLETGDLTAWLTTEKEYYSESGLVLKAKSGKLYTVDSSGANASITTIVEKDDNGNITSAVNILGDQVTIGNKGIKDVLTIQDDNLLLNGYLRTSVQDLQYADTINYQTITPEIIMANKYLVSNYLSLIINARSTGTNNTLELYLPNDFEYIGAHIVIVAAPWYDDTGTFHSPPSIKIRTGRHFRNHSLMDLSGTSDYEIADDYKLNGVVTKYGATNKELPIQPILNSSSWFIGKTYLSNAANLLTLQNGYIELLGTPGMVKPVCPYQAVLDSYNSHTLDTNSLPAIATNLQDSIYSLDSAKLEALGIETINGTFRETNMTIRKAPLCRWVVLNSEAYSISNGYESY